MIAIEVTSVSKHFRRSSTSVPRSLRTMRDRTTEIDYWALQKALYQR